jgi:hypothetical protein
MSAPATQLAAEIPHGDRRRIAAQVGVSLRTLHGVCGGRPCSWDLAFRLSAAVGGRVSAETIRGCHIPRLARLRESEPVPRRTRPGRAPEHSFSQEEKRRAA